MVQVWFDPLTKKRFNTENTYQAHVNSKKYKELLKQLGKETPAPVVSIKRPDGPGETPLHVVSHRIKQPVELLRSAWLRHRPSAFSKTGAPCMACMLPV